MLFDGPFRHDPGSRAEQAARGESAGGAAHYGRTRMPRATAIILLPARYRSDVG